MPYTPPSQQSPASSKASTPAISRNSSYSHDIGNLSPSHTRPNLPRSLSSATYLNKHRRSPSVTSPTAQDTLAATYKFNSGSKDTDSLSLCTSLRQSPPPLNDLVIPTGAIISPPDSSENSDGDETATKTAVKNARRNEVENTWNELQQAVRSMSKIKRSPSPVRTEPAVPHTTSSEPTTSMASPTLNSPPMRISPEARKNSHLRSSTETAVPLISATPSSQTSGSEDSDDEFRHGKPPLVRKKSGELVKPALRPSSRRRYSSMPGTPTYNKTVHFNDNGNQTRHFLQVDKPSAVSAGSSPVETYDSESEFPFQSKKTKIEWDTKLANFPSDDNVERKTRPVWVEKFFLSADNKSLVGQVAVANICFQKYVVARFTLDYWKTTSEVSAEFSNDVRTTYADGYDRFTFSIRLADQANLETKTLLLCVKYNAAGQEHWDNNNDTNFQIDFVKRITNSRETSSSSTLGARPVHAIPRSRNSPRGRPRAPSIDDDMAAQVDSSKYHFGASSANELLGDDHQTTIKLKPRTKRATFASSTVPQPSQGLGGRYDFGASLSAALSNAQDKLGKDSGLLAPKPASDPAQSYFAQDSVKTPPKKPSQRPEQMATDRPAIGSAQYQDLVSKYCYFTPSVAQPAAKLSPQGKRTTTSSDGAVDDDSYFQSGSKSPSPSSLSPQMDGTCEINLYSSPTRVIRTGHSSDRPSSPASFGYPYHHKQDGFMSDTPTPTAIRG